VAVTDGGNLPAKYVIHAVGPGNPIESPLVYVIMMIVVWSGGDQGEPGLLRDAVLNSLKKAKEMNLQSIAIPAISSGVSL
jgi:O-acetyl-ADP-ribose deacetylase (regulator of RNase III)